MTTKSFRDESHRFAGGLKFVRWGYKEKVSEGQEVEIVQPGSEKLTYTVKPPPPDENFLIPHWCFYPRHKVIVSYKHDEVSIQSGDIVGLIETGISDGQAKNFCRVRTKSGVEKNIPEYCLYRFVKEEGNTDQSHCYAGGLKFVRWNFTASGNGELTVQVGNEVEIIQPGSKDNYYTVKFGEETGLIPEKCFYPRRKVKISHRPKPDSKDQIAVSQDETIGVIGYDEEREMFKIMNEGGGEGKIPEDCLYRHAKAAPGINTDRGEPIQASEASPRSTKPTSNGRYHFV